MGIIPFPFQNRKTITFINNDGINISVDCELPQSDEEKTQGLLHRDELCSECGVLFDSDGFSGYHMIGMKFPIEMIFINGNQVVDIINAKPGDENISPQVDYTKNLEVNDGFCVKNGVSVGCKIVG